MDDAKTQLANRLKEANNVLVSVTNNPNVDQFAAAIALTLILNKLGKHATTVFSGTIPSLVGFLQPEKVVEKNTDSLRDFIISLDKSKADKLRYKIEDNFVKIFITPYHSSIGEKDLVFSQGDFNVDVVVGLGVHKREELDQAIIAHGRILHDATVTTVNTQPPSTLGSINWANGTSSSICEMLVDLTDLLAKQGLLDTQISNALLTGIVSETQRFSNRKTTATTMSASSKLLASGANQQLVATQLTPKPAPLPPPPPPPPPVLPHPPKPAPMGPPPPPPKKESTLPQQLKSVEKDDKKKNEYGVLEINHSSDGSDPDVKTEEESVAQVSINDQGDLMVMDGDAATAPPPAPPQQPVVEPEVDKQADVKEEATPELKPAPPLDLPPPTLPETQVPAMPDYVPPPLVAIPADSSQKPDPTKPVDIPKEEPKQVEPPKQEEQPKPNDSASSPKPVMEPPPTDAMLNGDNFTGADSSGFGTPGAGEGSIPPNSPMPMMSHNNSPPPVEQLAEKPPLVAAPPPSMSSPNSSNLADVRDAVNNALTASPASIANQPLASLNSQEVDIGLNSPAPQQGAPIAPGSSMEPKIVSPTQATVPEAPDSGQMSMSAPPVPPPIVPINDNNLPPSFTAL